MSLVALSELLGASVRDGHRHRPRTWSAKIAIAPQDHPTRVAYLVVKTSGGERLLPADDVESCGSTVRAGDGIRAGGVRIRHQTASCCSSATSSINRSSTSTAARSSG